MAEAEDDESSLSEPFWEFETVSEGRVVRTVLQRRFPWAWQILSESLEGADPFEIVYPGNPDEYSDVVEEVIVLLAPVHGDLRRLSASEIGHLIREGLARRFGEIPDQERLVKTVELIVSKVSAVTTDGHDPTGP